MTSNQRVKDLASEIAAANEPPPEPPPRTSGRINPLKSIPTSKPEDREAGSQTGTALMQRILDPTRRDAHRSQLAVSFQGYAPTTGADQIADDRIMLVDGNGKSWDWLALKQFYGPGNAIPYTKEDGTQGWRLLDKAMTLDDWVNGGWATMFADMEGITTDDVPDYPGADDNNNNRSRSGPVAPVYSPPDEAVAAEQVRNYVVATTGTANQQIIDEATKVLMAKDRESWNARINGEAQIDAWQATKESVRSSRAYGAVHSGRPDSVDEMEWVTGRQAKFRQLGLAAPAAEVAGINAAISGATDEALVKSAQVTQMGDTGRLFRQQRESLKQSATAATRLL